MVFAPFNSNKNVIRLKDKSIIPEPGLVPECCRVKGNKVICMNPECEIRGQCGFTDKK